MVNKAYMATVETEGFSADYLDDVIVIASNEADAKREAEGAMRSYRPMATVKDGETEVYELNIGLPRVVGILVPRDER